MRKISSRLNRLETVETSPNDEAEKLLVELLAKRDAAFYPWRSPSLVEKSRPLQEGYLAGTLGLLAKGSGIDGWKLAQALRSRLTQSGFCKPLGSRQVSSLILTPLGEATARAWLAGELLQLSDVIEFLDHIKRLKGREFLGQRWHSESELFGAELVGDPSEWSVLLEILLPLLTAGMLIGNCDLNGRAYFRIGEIEPPTFPSVKVDPKPELQDAYGQAFKSERAAITAAEDDDVSRISIPIPAT